MRVGGDDTVAFDDLSKFPTGHHIGDAAVLLNCGNNYLGHQFAGAIDKQFAALAEWLVTRTLGW